MYFFREVQFEGSVYFCRKNPFQRHCHRQLLLKAAEEKRCDVWCRHTVSTGGHMTSWFFSRSSFSVLQQISLWQLHMCPWGKKVLCVHNAATPPFSLHSRWLSARDRQVGRACHVFQFMFGWDELLSDVFLETDVSNGHLTVSEWHRVLVSVEMTSNMMKPTVQGK